MSEKEIELQKRAEEELRMTGHEDWSTQGELDFGEQEKFHTESWNINHKRWDWVLNEIIWAFEQLQPDCDWEEQYRSGEHDIVWNPASYDKDGKILTYSMDTGPKDTYKCDYEARAKHQARISNGLKLFGIYYQGLWD